ncbi:hypothetical protein [Flagellimonas sp. S3867]|uniref:hypothetical protein n=1 Tax=Flagellimonas sp. S3867 TaxID=2768063 RepID=UPI0016894BEB|nr:hypothetical protein [Flagellimonas sp. S3867]
MKSATKRFFFSVFAIWTIGQTKAQNELRDFYGVYYDPVLYLKQYESEEGSPYLNVDFKPAKINDSKKTYLVRINAHKGSAEVWVGENKIIELSNESANRIRLTHGIRKQYESAKYKNPKGALGYSFFQVLSKNNKYDLYIKERIKYFKKQKAEAYQAAKPSRFEKVKPHFYVRIGKDEKKPLLYIPQGIKRFVQTFSKSNQKSVKSFIKEENINLQTKDDLIRVFDFITNL